LQIASGWLNPAIHCPSPNCNERPLGTDISLLVVHNISLPPDTFGTGHVPEFFLNRLDCTIHPYFDTLRGLEVSAHCFIDREGAITQFVSFDERAWHAGQSVFQGRANCNDFSIGVELEGADHIPYTKAQYSVLGHLTQCLMQHYPSITKERIVGHSDIAPGRKTDPGPAFDWQRLHSHITN